MMLRPSSIKSPDDPPVPGIEKTSGEGEKIRERYQRRENNEIVKKQARNFYFSHFTQAERELKFLEIINRRFGSPGSLKLMEIGAGTGTNLFFFKRMGFQWGHIHANELLPDRFKVLADIFPNIKTYEGDACELEARHTGLFDIVFQSTVFTSILDDAYRKKLAGKMWTLLKPGGIILWYDFAFDNPGNKDVKGIKKSEIKKLFQGSKCITFHRTTLAPPIGRSVKKLYPFFNLFPFLRTHLVAEIEK